MNNLNTVYFIIFNGADRSSEKKFWKSKIDNTIMQADKIHYFYQQKGCSVTSSWHCWPTYCVSGGSLETGWLWTWRRVVWGWASLFSSSHHLCCLPLRPTSAPAISDRCFYFKTIRYILVCKLVKFIVLRLSVLDLFTNMFISVFNPYVLVFDSVRYKILNLTYQNFHHFFIFFK